MKWKAGDTIKYTLGLDRWQVVYTIVIVLQDKYLVRTPAGYLWECKFTTFDSKEYDAYVVGGE